MTEERNLLVIDGVSYRVNPDRNLLQAILSLGLDLPYFCWHPALGSVGSCRQCAVTQYRDEEDDTGRVVMACMTPVAEEMHVGLNDAQSSEFRAGIIEALMTNHPHDCPVCEEGGECHLQDMTEMSGHTFRRYRGLKRTHRNQYLGPFINHEMNRCIACYRCVRFYQDYAGDRDLSVQGAHNHVYFGRERDGVLESPFSGNLVEVCPTGVFTDRTYSRRYARKWDLQCAPSICTHCAVGCNTTPAERYGSIVRITNRYNAQLNGYFLCDRGRFGYEFSNAPQRISHAYRPVADGQEELDADRELAQLLERIRDPAHRVFGVGSPRSSLEDNFALRTLVGEDHFFAGIDAAEWACLARHRQLAAQWPLATIRDIESADAALIIGEDLGNTAPRVELALRQMVRNAGIEYAAEQGAPRWQDAAVRSLGQWSRTPLWQLVPQINRVSAISDNDLFAAPDDIVLVAGAIAHALDEDAPSPSGLTDRQREWAEQAAQMLNRAQRPLLMGGASLGQPAALDALANIARALKKSSKGESDQKQPMLYIGALEANSLGLAALTKRSINDLLAIATDGQECSLVVLENDLSRRLSPEAFGKLRDNTHHWLVLDHLATPTAGCADAVLPVPDPFERQGTLVNASGLAQTYFPVRHNPRSLPAWHQFARATAQIDASAWETLTSWQSSEQVRSALAADPAFDGLDSVALGPDYREKGRKLLRQSHRYSGRTAMHAHEHVSETPPPRDLDSPYAFSMEGSWGEGGERAAVWAPGWNSEQALNKFQQEVGGDWREPMPAVRLPFRQSAEDGYLSTPTPPAPQRDGWRLVPRYEVFGSEELSRYAGAVVERGGPPRVWVDAETARHFSLADWDSIEIHWRDGSETLYVAIDDTLPLNTAAVPPHRTESWLPLFDTAERVQLQAARQPLPRPPELIAREGHHG